MTKPKLDAILDLHRKWIAVDSDGVRANLWGADLRGADLRGANLWGADLRGADLRGANLRGAHLRGANLQNANLQNADLQNADLRGAGLRGADLRGANLDFSCLPLWCGGQFMADKRICQQLVAHTLRVMELSELPDANYLQKRMARFCKGWHRETEFK